MHVENTEEFVDMIAQAVVDRMQVQAQMDAIGETVFRRIIAMQQEQAAALVDTNDEDRAQDGQEEEIRHAGE
jgi:hypothetical protein